MSESSPAKLKVYSKKKAVDLNLLPEQLSPAKVFSAAPCLQSVALQDHVLALFADQGRCHNDVDDDDDGDDDDDDDDDADDDSGDVAIDVSDDVVDGYVSDYDGGDDDADYDHDDGVDDETHDDEYDVGDDGHDDDLLRPWRIEMPFGVWHSRKFALQPQNTAQATTN